MSLDAQELLAAVRCVPFAANAIYSLAQHNSLWQRIAAVCYMKWSVPTSRDKFTKCFVWGRRNAAREGKKEFMSSGTAEKGGSSLVFRSLFLFHASNYDFVHGSYGGSMGLESDGVGLDKEYVCHCLVADGRYRVRRPLQVCTSNNATVAGGLEICLAGVDHSNTDPASIRLSCRRSRQFFGIAGMWHLRRRM